VKGSARRERDGSEGNRRLTRSIAGGGEQSQFDTSARRKGVESQVERWKRLQGEGSDRRMRGALASGRGVFASSRASVGLCWYPRAARSYVDHNFIHKLIATEELTTS
jgi:hypothetical protein